MKNLILNLALAMLFLLGSTAVSIGNTAAFTGIGETVLVIDKNASNTNTFAIPSKYTTSDGTLVTPYFIEVIAHASNQSIFAVTSKDGTLDLSDLALKQGYYTITFKIGDYTDSCVFKKA